MLHLGLPGVAGEVIAGLGLRPRGEVAARRGGRGEARRSLIDAEGAAGDEAAVTTAPEAIEGAAGEAAAAEARAPRERRSRDRYGRDRRARGETPAGAEATPAAAAEGDTAAAEAPARSYFTAAAPDAGAGPIQASAVPQALPQQMAVETVVTEPVLAAGEAPAAPVAIEAEPPVAAAAAQPYQLAVQQLSALARSAGLEWVQSDAAKVAQVQAAIAAEPVPVRVPREPRKVVLVDEGPLILVETRRDLGAMKLPFEA
jgi:ribonuclease E